MSGRKRRKTTLGTGVAILLTLVVLVSSGFVLLRLGSGHRADLSRLNMQVISLETKEGAGEQPEGGAAPRYAEGDGLRHDARRL